MTKMTRMTRPDRVDVKIVDVWGDRTMLRLKVCPVVLARLSALSKKAINRY